MAETVSVISGRGSYQEFLRDFEETIRSATTRLHEISAEVLTRQRDKHSLDQIAFKTIDPSVPATLEYLIRDYLDHLKHHLDQIWRHVWRTPTNN